MSWQDIRPLLEKRQTAWSNMKGLLDTCAAEGRSLDGQEQASYEQWEAEIDAADKQLDIIKRAQDRDKRFNEQDHQPSPDADLLPGGGADAEERAKQDARMVEFRRFLAGDKRALQVESDTEGGYLLAPQQLAVGLIQAVDDLTFIRRIAHRESLTQNESLGVVSLDTDLNDADWTSELATSTVDEALRLGKRELKAQYLSKETKLSRPLVRRTARGAERLVMERLAYKFAITEEKAFLTGSGAGQPLGVFTASAQGISTGRDVSTGNTTTDIGADGLIEAKHNQKGQYWPRLRWIFHRDAIKRIRKLKDGNGLYIWTPGSGIGNGLTSGVPDTILDVPYFMSEYAPNTFTTGLYVGIIGDFEFYWIVDVLQLEIQMLNELYARTNQFGYIGRKELDGMPVLEEAFTRVKLA